MQINTHKVIKRLYIDEEIEETIIFVNKTNYLDLIDELISEYSYRKFFITIERDTNILIFETMGVLLKYEGLTKGMINRIKEKYSCYTINYLKNLDDRRNRYY